MCGSDNKTAALYPLVLLYVQALSILYRLMATRPLAAPLAAGNCQPGRCPVDLPHCQGQDPQAAPSLDHQWGWGSTGERRDGGEVNTARVVIQIPASTKAVI